MTEPYKLVASLLVLRQKLHSFHWNVTGPSFLELHKLFQTQYEEVLSFADRVAEYIRTMGEHPPPTLRQILQLSLIGEDDSLNLPWKKMVQILYGDFIFLSEYIENMQYQGNRAWNNILDDLSEFLNKQKWFLRSYIE